MTIIVNISAPLPNKSTQPPTTILVHSTLSCKASKSGQQRGDGAFLVKSDLQFDATVTLSQLRHHIDNDKSPSSFAQWIPAQARPALQLGDLSSQPPLSV